MSTHRIARAGALAAATGAVLLLTSGVASAHVSARIIGEAAEQGAYTKITFRVPNEDDAAGTVKLEVKLPADAPMSSVRPRPVPGWTAKVTTATLDEPIESHGAEITEAPATVTWTANPGVRIAPGEFEEFEISAGPLPEVDQLVMPTIQTYEGGKVVAWDAPPPADGGAEPDRPAPVIELSPASSDGGHAAPAGTEDTATDQADGTATEAAADSGTDDTARWLGGAGLVVGALGLGFGVGATMRARRAGGGQR